MCVKRALSLTFFQIYKHFEKVTVIDRKNVLKARSEMREVNFLLKSTIRDYFLSATSIVFFVRRRPLYPWASISIILTSLPPALVR